jgi:hypothetical protein
MIGVNIRGVEWIGNNFEMILASRNLKKEEISKRKKDKDINI